MGNTLTVQDKCEIIGGIFTASVIINNSMKITQLADLVNCQEYTSPRITEFQKFFNNYDIYKLYSYKPSDLCPFLGDLYPFSSSSDEDTPNIVYINIIGTTEIYPFPYNYLMEMDHPFFRRQLDGSMNMKNVIKTPDNNLFLKVSWNHPSQFIYVYQYMIDGCLKNISITSSTWTDMIEDALMYFLGVDSPCKSS